MIKAIIFDLGGVLFTNGAAKFANNLRTRFNLADKLLNEAMNGEKGILYREGKISRDEFWQNFLEKLKINVDINKLEKEWFNEYELVIETKDIILNLKKKYKLYYLSDSVKERVEFINNKYHFIEWFDGGVFAHDVGVKKPKPKIYEIALQKAQVIPEEALYIDDKQSSLIPADKLGIKTVLFISPEDLKNKLKELNILI